MQVPIHCIPVLFVVLTRNGWADYSSLAEISAFLCNAPKPRAQVVSFRASQREDSGAISIASPRGFHEQRDVFDKKLRILMLRSVIAVSVVLSI
jgi:hypothetical protein